MRIFTVLACLLLFACNNAKEGNAPKKLEQKVASTIFGTIDTPNYPNIILESNGEQYTAMIQNGQFAFNLMLDEPRIFNIQYGRRQGKIYITPGDKVVFSTSANQFSQVMNFTGTRAVENNYLTEKVNNDFRSKSQKVNTYKLEEAEFIPAVEKSRQENASAFATFTQNNPELDKFFKFLMETEVEFEWATDRLIYPFYHEFYAKKENFDVSPVYYDFLRELDKDDPGKLYAPNYTAFISNYIDMEAKKILDKDNDLKLTSNGLAKTKFKVIGEHFKSTPVKEFLMYNTLKTHIRYEGANGTPELISQFNTAAQNENFKKDIQKDYSVWQGLEEGKPAPTFAYHDIEGKVYDIAALKGKVIYVDIWATWCGPCKKEIPHLEELQESFEGNEKIIFTSVSIDKDKSAWERMVKDKSMKGLQLFAEGEWRSSIIQDYKVTGIPRFLLIGADGNIISANAPRPSSERLKPTLEKLVGLKG